jgi:hypothetical protein
MLIVFNIDNLRKSGAKLRILKGTFYDLNHKKRARGQEGKRARGQEGKRAKGQKGKEKEVRNKGVASICRCIRKSLHPVIGQYVRKNMEIRTLL